MDLLSIMDRLVLVLLSVDDRKFCFFAYPVLLSTMLRNIAKFFRVLVEDSIVLDVSRIF